MGKLNIAHHKSYHPYRRDNIERVRKDEEEAKLKEEKEEGRLLLADSEARIDLLRQRAGVTNGESSSSSGGYTSKIRRRREEEADEERRIAGGSGLQQGAVLPTTNGHINLFEDLEHTQIAIAAAIRSSKKPGTAPAESEKGVPLAPSTKDLNPWYSERSSGHDDSQPREEQDAERWRREEVRKYSRDPLTSVKKKLAARSSSFSSNTTPSSRSMHPPALPSSSQPTQTTARLSRESSERERALALIRRKKREMEGNMTPSTVADDSASEYGDMYNRREVREAHRYREHDEKRHGERYGDESSSRGRDAGYDRRRWDDFEGRREDGDTRRSRSTSRW